MAKKPQNLEPETSIDHLNEQMVDMAEKVQKNQKIIVWISVAVVIVVALILGYVYLIHQPAIEKSNESIGKADIQLALGNDSVALAQYMNIADDMSGDAQNRAALQSAILLYDKADYPGALDYLDKFSASESVIGAAAYSLKGDCYANLDQLDNAVAAFKDAISKSDKNPYYTPFFMTKLARVYRAQKNYAAEADTYQDIIKNYPNFGDNYGIDMKKYAERAKLQAQGANAE